MLRDLCLEPLGLSVTAAAKALGVSRKTLSAVLNGHADVSPKTAIRLAVTFDTSAERWLPQQLHDDRRAKKQESWLFQEVLMALVKVNLLPKGSATDMSRLPQGISCIPASSILVALCEQLRAKRLQLVRFNPHRRTRTTVVVKEKRTRRSGRFAEPQRHGD